MELGLNAVNTNPPVNPNPESSGNEPNPNATTQSNFEAVLKKITDTNSDGKFTSDEIKGFIKEANTDGQKGLSFEEFSARLNSAASTYAPPVTSVPSAGNTGTQPVSSTQSALGADYQQALLGADLNKDGSVTRQELDNVIAAGPGGVERNFTAADANQDGVLTGAEKTPFLQSFIPAELAGDQQTISAVDAAFDTNADGAIDRSEVNAQIGGGSQLLNDAFAAADVNGDNVADASEIAGLTNPTSGGSAPVESAPAESVEGAEGSEGSEVAEGTGEEPALSSEEAGGGEEVSGGEEVGGGDEVSGSEEVGETSEVSEPVGATSGATPSEIQQTLAGLDLNGDGKITREEADSVIAAGPGGVEKSFAAADANQDGVLSGAEVKPFIQTFLPPELANDQATIDQVTAAFDANGDGTIDKSEVEAQIGGGSQLINDAFAAADVNGDNVVDADELAAVGSSTSGTPETPASETSESSEPVETPTESAGAAPSELTGNDALAALFASIDRNGDGVISRAELRDALNA